MIDFSNKDVAILGMGKSGLALAKEISERGGNVFVSDTRSAEELQEAIAFLQEIGVDFEVGSHSDRLLQKDMIIISPGVSVHHPLLEKAREKGLKVLGEVEVAWQLSPVPFIAVTGTNGKSTTVTLIDRMLGNRSILAGNIGTPLVSEVAHAPANGFVVAEVSSFQLESVEYFQPKIAILTNVTPDHLDRHPNLQEYFAAKARLFARMDRSDLAIFSDDDPQAVRMRKLLEDDNLPSWLTGYAKPKRDSLPQIMTFSVQHPVERGAWFSDGWLWYKNGDKAEKAIEWRGFAGLPGIHNIANALAALIVAKYLQINNDDIREALSVHKPLHYRMEEVHRLGKVRFINDSKATNVSSVVSSLESFKDEPLALIAGGKDKGFDFTPLGEAIVKYCQWLILIGEAADRLEKTVRDCGEVEIIRAKSLQEAVEIGWSRLKDEGGVLLLSPACSSFDMFKNAEERGALFSEYARSLGS
ncbi:UDP-N-acetylmuramoyl-L-alanine--D-glutamate ligase [bacterium]|nr:UDP-N-acetylmuramoyl-L-alanine--D-glutamate ligase [bacterium]